jgi:hypothetical protein
MVAAQPTLHILCILLNTILIVSVNEMSIKMAPVTITGDTESGKET